jgi:dynactin 1
MKYEIRELKEKIDKLKVKRLQEKERIKEFEKVKLKMEKIIELKYSIME